MSANLASLLKAKLAPLEKRIADLEAEVRELRAFDAAAYARDAERLQQIRLEEPKKRGRPKKPKPE